MPLDTSGRKYPVMIACIGEARAPDVQEVKWVAKRILREAFPHVDRVRRDDTSFYRRILLTARATLGLTSSRPDRDRIDHEASCALSDGSVRSKSRLLSISRLTMISARE